VTTTAPQHSPQAPAALLPVTAGARLMRLYLLSRRVPAASCLLAALGCLLWVALHWHWNIAGGPAAQLVIPLVIETGAAAIVAVSSHGPFGEPERATGRWLPWLRLATAVALAAVAFALLSAGATGGYLPGGDPALLRNLAGITGVGLLSATALGGAFGWVGPMGYLLFIEGALAGGLTTPWAWPARPAGDLGGALCASAVLAAGLAAVALRGARGYPGGSAGRALFTT
jgi:hypothetical protein